MAVEIEDEADRFDDGLSERLEQLGYYSTGDTVGVRIEEVTTTGRGHIDVHFVPPLGDEFVERYPEPHDPDEDNGFLDLLDYCGHSLVTADSLVDERIPFEYDGNWSLSLPGPTPTRRERVRARYNEIDGHEILRMFAWVSGLVCYPLVVLPFIGWMLFADRPSGHRLDGSLIAVMALIVWALAAGLFVMVDVATLELLFGGTIGPDGAVSYELDPL